MNERADLSAEVWNAQDLLRLIEDGVLALPDFQRRFEWSVSDVRSYLSTVLAGLPSGSLLISDNHNIQVQLRSLEGAPELSADTLPSASVLLDGQQRLTALWQATHDIGPERYFVDFHALIDGADLLQDSVVVSSSAHQVEKFVTRAVDNGQLLVPMSALMTPSLFFSWLQFGDPNRRSVIVGDELLGTVFAEQIQPVATYKVPVIRLRGDLNLSTVAQIFERTNKGGQKLDAFDLLVARLQGVGWSLRAAWEEATKEFPEIGRVFGDSGFSTISAISLVLQSDVRRSAVLSMSPSLVSENWETAVSATRDVARILLRQGVRQPQLLPYDAIATAMVAARMVDVPPQLLAKYFWGAAANLRYEVASNTKVGSDFRAISQGSMGEILDSWSLTSEVIELNTRRSSRALWATLIAFLLSGDPLDLATGQRLTSAEPDEEDHWDLVPLSKGGGFVETEKDVPARLRTVGQLMAFPGRSGRLQRLGLVGLVRNRIENPELEFFAGIDACLKSQLMPSSGHILTANVNPRKLIADRSAEIQHQLENRIFD